MRAFFSWQHAILKSELEPTTRLVCLTIGCHMALDGTGCFPSYAKIAEESGLGRRTVIDHVQKAIEAGYLTLEHRERENGSSTSNLYQPTMPGVVQELHQGGAPAALGVVQELHPHNTPSLTPQLTSTPVTPDDGFEEFWAMYPNKVGKPKAHSAWRRLKLAEQVAVIAALPAWKDCRQWVGEAGRYIPHPTTFLNRRQWEDDPGQLMTPVQSKPITDMEIPM